MSKRNRFDKKFTLPVKREHKPQPSNYDPNRTCCWCGKWIDEFSCDVSYVYQHYIHGTCQSAALASHEFHERYLKNYKRPDWTPTVWTEWKPSN